MIDENHKVTKFIFEFRKITVLNEGNERSNAAKEAFDFILNQKHHENFEQGDNFYIIGVGYSCLNEKNVIQQILAKQFSLSFDENERNENWSVVTDVDSMK